MAFFIGGILMRNLKTSDIFAASRLLNKIGIREEIREVARQAEENKGKRVTFDAGFDLLLGVLEKATSENAEKEIYCFISNILECEREEVRDMDPFILFEKLEEVADLEKWKNFFERVAKLMKLK